MRPAGSLFLSLDGASVSLSLPRLLSLSLPRVRPSPAISCAAIRRSSATRRPMTSASSSTAAGRRAPPTASPSTHREDGKGAQRHVPTPTDPYNDPTLLWLGFRFE